MDTFPMHQGEMPCKPCDIMVGMDCLPGNLGGAAMQILRFSQREGKWVGVSWPQILQVMLDDYRASQAAYDKILKQEHDDFLRKEKFTYSLKCWLTLGIYSFFGRKHDTQPRYLPYQRTWNLAALNLNATWVDSGIKFLLEREMLRHVPGEDGDVFYPTAKLITAILEKQGGGGRAA